MRWESPLLVDPLHACIALGPLAVYLLLVGVINMSRRPLVTTGARDTAALGLGLSGLVVAGPMELFLPEAAAISFGWLVWALLMAFYGLCLTLIVLMMKPRLVIYNVTSEQLRSILARVVNELDDEARWAGESLALPKLGIQLHVEPVSSMRNAALVAAGPNQSYSGWKQFENRLAGALRQTKGEPNSYGALPLVFGLLMMCLIAFLTIRYPQAVAQSFQEMFRL